MFKNLSGTVRTLLFIGIAAIVVLAAVLIGSLALRVDVARPGKLPWLPQAAERSSPRKSTRKDSATNTALIS